jgi:phospholipid/cholesterol/gamma-HCH transport system substrate-binding protein
MKKEVKIALVAIAALVIMFFGMNFLKGTKMFSKNDQYVITFKDVTGIEKNSPIYSEGVVIGSVSDIIYDYSHKEPTHLKVYISKMMRIPKGSTAEVKSDIMGNTQVNLLLADNESENINPGEIIRGLDQESTVDRMKAMIPTVESIAPKLDSILLNLNIILSDPAIRDILHNAKNVTANLETSTKELNSLMAELNSKLPSMMDKTDRVLDNAEVMTKKFAAIDVDGMMSQVNQTLSDVQSTVAKINSTDGTMGKLINDPKLYDNLNTTLNSANSLVVDLKENPKRYVHFSLFGKKSK